MSKGTTKRSTRVDDSLWEEAQAAASERGDTLSDIIRRGLWEYVNNHVQQKDSDAHILSALVADLDKWAGRSKSGYYDEAQDDVVQILNPYRSQA